jgi:hypothetical protein
VWPAAVFIGISVTHLISLIVNRNCAIIGRKYAPNTNDPREALSGFAYNLGLASTDPSARRTVTSKRRILGSGVGRDRDDRQRHPCSGPTTSR